MVIYAPSGINQPTFNVLNLLKECSGDTGFHINKINSSPYAIVQHVLKLGILNFDIYNS